MTGMRVSRVSTEEGFYSLKDEWNSLLGDSPANNFFLRWEWLWSWWRAYRNENSELCILVFSSQEGIVCIAPFYISGGKNKNKKMSFFSPRRLMFLGTSEESLISEYMDIIFRDGFENEAIEGALRVISDNCLCDDLLLHKIDFSSRTIPVMERAARKLGFFFSVCDRAESPYIRLPKSYGEFVGSLGKSMQRKIRTNKKRVAGHGGVVIRKSGPDGFASDFGEFVRLHQMRWHSKGMPGSFARGRFKGFQAEVMLELLKKGFLDLWFLSVSGKNIAALYNINYKNKIYFFQAGLDAGFDKKLAPGFMLHDHCIREAIEGGLAEYDFLLMGGSDQYKKKWTDGSRPLGDIYLARPGALKYFLIAKDKAKNYLKAAGINR